MFVMYMYTTGTCIAHAHKEPSHLKFIGHVSIQQMAPVFVSHLRGREQFSLSWKVAFPGMHLVQSG